jgi:hypothetical protein
VANANRCLNCFIAFTSYRGWLRELIHAKAFDCGEVAFASINDWLGSGKLFTNCCMTATLVGAKVGEAVGAVSFAACVADSCFS